MAKEEWACELENLRAGAIAPPKPSAKGDRLKAGGSCLSRGEKSERAGDFASGGVIHINIIEQEAGPQAMPVDEGGGLAAAQSHPLQSDGAEVASPSPENYECDWHKREAELARQSAPPEPEAPPHQGFASNPQDTSGDHTLDSRAEPEPHTPPPVFKPKQKDWQPPPVESTPHLTAEPTSQLMPSSVTGDHGSTLEHGNDAEPTVLVGGSLVESFPTNDSAKISDETNTFVPKTVALSAPFGTTSEPAPLGTSSEQGAKVVRILQEPKEREPPIIEVQSEPAEEDLDGDHTQGSTFFEINDIALDEAGSSGSGTSMTSSRFNNKSEQMRENVKLDGAGEVSTVPRAQRAEPMPESTSGVAGQSDKDFDQVEGSVAITQPENDTYDKDYVSEKAKNVSENSLDDQPPCETDSKPSGQPSSRSKRAELASNSDADNASEVSEGHSLESTFHEISDLPPDSIQAFDSAVEQDASGGKVGQVADFGDSENTPAASSDLPLAPPPSQTSERPQRSVYELADIGYTSTEETEVTADYRSPGSHFLETPTFSDDEDTRDTQPGSEGSFEGSFFSNPPPQELGKPTLPSGTELASDWSDPPEYESKKKHDSKRESSSDAVNFGTETMSISREKAKLLKIMQTEMGMKIEPLMRYSEAVRSAPPEYSQLSSRIESDFSEDLLPKPANNAKLPVPGYEEKLQTTASDLDGAKFVGKDEGPGILKEPAVTEGNSEGTQSSQTDWRLGDEEKSLMTEADSEATQFSQADSRPGYEVKPIVTEGDSEGTQFSQRDSRPGYEEKPVVTEGDSEGTQFSQRDWRPGYEEKPVVTEGNSEGTQISQKDSRPGYEEKPAVTEGDSEGAQFSQRDSRSGYEEKPVVTGGDSEGTQFSQRDWRPGYEEKPVVTEGNSEGTQISQKDSRPGYEEKPAVTEGDSEGTQFSQRDSLPGYEEKPVETEGDSEGTQFSQRDSLPGHEEEPVVTEGNSEGTQISQKDSRPGYEEKPAVTEGDSEGTQFSQRDSLPGYEEKPVETEGDSEGTQFSQRDSLPGLEEEPVVTEGNSEGTQISQKDSRPGYEEKPAVTEGDSEGTQFSQSDWRPGSEEKPPITETDYGGARSLQKDTTSNYEEKPPVAKRDPEGVAYSPDVFASRGRAQAGSTERSAGEQRASQNLTFDKSLTSDNFGLVEFSLDEHSLKIEHVSDEEDLSFAQEISFERDLDTAPKFCPGDKTGTNDAGPLPGIFANEISLEQQPVGHRFLAKPSLESQAGGSQSEWLATVSNLTANSDQLFGDVFEHPDSVKALDSWLQSCSGSSSQLGLSSGSDASVESLPKDTPVVDFSAPGKPSGSATDLYFPKSSSPQSANIAHRPRAMSLDRVTGTRSPTESSKHDPATKLTTGETFELDPLLNSGVFSGNVEAPHDHTSTYATAEPEQSHGDLIQFSPKSPEKFSREPQVLAELKNDTGSVQQSVLCDDSVVEIPQKPFVTDLTPKLLDCLSEEICRWDEPQGALYSQQDQLDVSDKYAELENSSSVTDAFFPQPSAEPLRNDIPAQYLFAPEKQFKSAAARVADSVAAEFLSPEASRGGTGKASVGDEAATGTVQENLPNIGSSAATAYGPVSTGLGPEPLEDTDSDFTHEAIGDWDEPPGQDRTGGLPNSQQDQLDVSDKYAVLENSPTVADDILLEHTAESLPKSKKDANFAPKPKTFENAADISSLIGSYAESPPVVDQIEVPLERPVDAYTAAEPLVRQNPYDATTGAKTIVEPAVMPLTAGFAQKPPENDAQQTPQDQPDAGDKYGDLDTGLSAASRQTPVSTGSTQEPSEISKPASAYDGVVESKEPADHERSEAALRSERGQVGFGNKDAEPEDSFQVAPPQTPLVAELTQEPLKGSKPASTLDVIEESEELSGYEHSVATLLSERDQVGVGDKYAKPEDSFPVAPTQTPPVADMTQEPLEGSKPAFTDKATGEWEEPSESDRSLGVGQLSVSDNYDERDTGTPGTSPQTSFAIDRLELENLDPALGEISIGEWEEPSDRNRSAALRSEPDQLDVCEKFAEPEGSLQVASPQMPFVADLTQEPLEGSKPALGEEVIGEWEEPSDNNRSATDPWSKRDQIGVGDKYAGDDGPAAATFVLPQSSPTAVSTTVTEPPGEQPVLSEAGVATTMKYAPLADWNAPLLWLTVLSDEISPLVPPIPSSDGAHPSPSAPLEPSSVSAESSAKPEYVWPFHCHRPLGETEFEPQSFFEFPDLPSTISTLSQASGAMEPPTKRAISEEPMIVPIAGASELKELFNYGESSSYTDTTADTAAKWPVASGGRQARITVPDVADDDTQNDITDISNSLDARHATQKTPMIADTRQAQRPSWELQKSYGGLQNPGVPRVSQEPIPADLESCAELSDSQTLEGLSVGEEFSQVTGTYFPDIEPKVAIFERRKDESDDKRFPKTVIHIHPVKVTAKDDDISVGDQSSQTTGTEFSEIEPKVDMFEHLNDKRYDSHLRRTSTDTDSTFDSSAFAETSQFTGISFPDIEPKVALFEHRDNEAKDSRVRERFTEANSTLEEQSAVDQHSNVTRMGFPAIEPKVAIFEHADDKSQQGGMLSEELTDLDLRLEDSFAVDQTSQVTGTQFLDIEPKIAIFEQHKDGSDERDHRERSVVPKLPKRDSSNDSSEDYSSLTLDLAIQEAKVGEK